MSGLGTPGLHTAQRWGIPRPPTLDPVFPTPPRPSTKKHPRQTHSSNNTRQGEVLGRFPPNINSQRKHSPSSLGLRHPFSTRRYWECEPTCRARPSYSKQPGPGSLFVPPAHPRSSQGVQLTESLRYRGKSLPCLRKALQPLRPHQQGAPNQG